MFRTFPEPQIFCQVADVVRLVSLLTTFLLQYLIGVLFRGSIAGPFRMDHSANSDGCCPSLQWLVDLVRLV